MQLTKAQKLAKSKLTDEFLSPQEIGANRDTLSALVVKGLAFKFQDKYRRKP